MTTRLVPLARYRFGAPDMDDPNSADWAVNALAPLAAGSLNAGLSVRLFDDTTEEGVGFDVTIPPGAVNITFKFVSRAVTAPGAARTVGLKLYVRELPDNAAVEAWSAGLQLTNIDIPTNANWQYDSQTIALTTLSMVSPRVAQFELTRVAPTSGTNLTGDYSLFQVLVEFS